ncbi:hypothetical protein GCM10010389_56670 [Streptomyces echinoruber]|uniref:Uncharacterized protein n=1 Tax=Streptomyces echinoruber TaxID=68898 RepID=A0A918VMA9_9ACTN|nr:hypothetical protein GCM10010389_56670 [Streptomyces echinoruber]
MSSEGESEVMDRLGRGPGTPGTAWRPSLSTTPRGPACVALPRDVAGPHPDLWQEDIGARTAKWPYPHRRPAPLAHR